MNSNGSETASLILSLDSQGVTAGTSALQKLTAASGQAERATDNLGLTGGKTSSQMTTLASNLDGVSRAMEKLSRLESQRTALAARSIDTASRLANLEQERIAILNELATAEQGSGDLSNLNERIRLNEKLLAVESSLSEVSTARNAALEGVKASLRTQEEAIAASYKAQREIVIQNTKAGSDEQLALLKQLTDAEAAEIKALQSKELAILKSGLLSQEEEIRESYETRRQMILAATKLTDAEREALELRNQKRLNAELTALRATQQSYNATNASTSAGMMLLGAKVALVTAGLQALRSAFNNAKDAQKLNAMLKTATGSAEQATNAMANLKEFAKSTPYDLAQVVTAFIKLQNLGLDPSMESLESYGNTASAMGKQLDQMIEAVADAAVGEFERLKEFGIKAANQGDTIVFRFRGQSTEVANNAEAIQNYLINIGKTDFKGSMEEQMNTIDGALSNLGDKWFQFTAEYEESFTVLIQLLGKFADAAMFAIDAVALPFKAVGYALGGLVYGWDAMTEAMNRVPPAAKPIESSMRKIATETKKVVDYSEDVARVYDRLFERNATQAQLAEHYLERAAEKLKEFQAIPVATGDEKERVRLYNEYLDLLTKGETIQSDLSQRLTEAANKHNDYIRGQVDSETQLLILDLQRKAALEDLAKAQEGGATTEAIEAQVKAYERLNEIEGQIGDVKNNRDGALEGVKASLRTQEEAIKASYEARKQIVIDNTREESDTRRQLLEELNAAEDKDLNEYRDQLRNSLRDGLLSEEDEINESYQRRKQLILDSTAVTEDERRELLDKLESQHTTQLRAAEISKYKTAFSAFQDFQDNMLVLAKTKNKTAANAYKAMAIANTVIKTYESATSAYAAMASIPYVGPALGIAAAAAAIGAGLANVAAIKAQNYSGAYATGGQIPAGSYGLVGEAGPELVQGPAVVTSARTTLDNYLSQQESGNGANSSSGVTIAMTNTFGSNVDPVQMRKFASDIQQATMSGFMDAMDRGGSFRKRVRGAA